MKQSTLIAGFVFCFFIFLIPLTLTLNTVNITGYARYFDSGNDVTGNITVIVIETSNKTSSTFSSGDFTYNQANLDTDNANYITIIIDDNEEMGYAQLKINSQNLTDPSCVTQNITVNGYAVDKDDGSNLASGNIHISILEDETYTNSASFTTTTWAIDFHPCLVPGKLYTLQIVIMDSAGDKGTIFVKYPAM